MLQEPTSVPIELNNTDFRMSITFWHLFKTGNLDGLYDTYLQTTVDTVKNTSTKKNVHTVHVYHFRNPLTNLWPHNHHAELIQIHQAGSISIEVFEEFLTVDVQGKKQQTKKGMDWDVLCTPPRSSLHLDNHISLGAYPYQSSLSAFTGSWYFQ